MISHVLREGLEGLVLKGINTTYEPGKRHWLKVKKDYLQGAFYIQFLLVLSSESILSFSITHTCRFLNLLCA